MRLVLALLLLGACGSDSNLGAGATCSSSDECGPGLLCDFGQKPHVCSPTSTAPRDMAMKIPDAGPDASMSTDLGPMDLSPTD